MQISLAYIPVQGKTYSLFGHSTSTFDYYARIEKLVDKILEKFAKPELVLQTIRKYSGKKRIIKKIAQSRENDNLISFIIHLITPQLNEFTEMVHNHLKSLPVSKFWDRRLSTTREQYHLYMIEIELSNRIYRNRFIESDVKIALLPHCLRDFKTECKSGPDGFDYQCKYCSKNCYQNYISRLLKENQIEPYIWMGADLKLKAKELYKNRQSLGILGIACIPELAWGLRKCQKYSIPAIGLPLDSNRCQRWMGKFHENSVNLDRLEMLISGLKKGVKTGSM